MIEILKEMQEKSREKRKGEMGNKITGVTNVREVGREEKLRRDCKERRKLVPQTPRRR